MKTRKRGLHQLLIGKKSNLSSYLTKNVKNAKNLPEIKKENIMRPILFPFPIHTTLEEEIIHKNNRKKIRKREVVLIPLNKEKTLELSPEEYDALCLIARGNKNKVILKKVYISGQKLSILRKKFKEIPKPIARMLKEKSGEILREKKGKYESNISLHSTGTYRRKEL